MSMSNLWKHFAATLAMCLLAAGFAASAARAQVASKPLLLVASPTLQGPFRQTALVVVPVGGRHFGFILNRTTGVTLSTLFPGHAPSAKVTAPVHFGGPVMSNALFAVVPRNPGEEALRLFGDLFVTNRAAAINQIIEQTPNDARFFAGFVSWQPGALESEIADGAWYFAEPDADLVFRADTSGMWEELVNRPGNGSAPRLAPGLIQIRFEAAPGPRIS